MSHEKLAKTFDQWADDGRDVGMEHEHGDVTRQVIERLGIQPGEMILDLGCGNGWSTRLLARAAAGAQAIGVDVSPRMIERAEALHSLTIRARYEVGRFESLDFKAGKFDRVFSVEALYYAADLERALAEIARVLKPGGRADLVIDFYAESPTTGDWPAKTGLSMHRLGADQWCQALARAGLTETLAQRVRDTRDAASFDPAHAASKADGSLWLCAKKPR